VKDRAFSFEIKDLMIQFVAAFDNVIIKRYNSIREEQDQIQVRYVYSPKQRVLFDIVNRSQNLTLPVIAVSINSVSRDNDRVFNKIAGFYTNKTQTESNRGSTSAYMRTPVPVNISVNMSILAKYQSDMDQIISNFVPYNDPYIIISWKVPESAGLSIPQEIRSEILWDGNLNMTYPTDINASDKYRISADTSFTIKGWLFKDLSKNAVSNIFFIDNNFNLDTSFSSLTSFNADTR
jgi:hypothetical protein